MSLYDKKLDHSTDWAKLAQIKTHLETLDSVLFKALVAGCNAFIAFELSDDDAETLENARNDLADYPEFADHFEALIDGCKDRDAIKRLFREEDDLKKTHKQAEVALKKTINDLEQGAILGAIGAFNTTLMPKAKPNSDVGSNKTDYANKVFKHIQAKTERKAFVAFGANYAQDSTDVRLFVQVNGDLVELAKPEGFGLTSATKARMALSTIMLHSHSPEMLSALEAWMKSGYEKLDSKGLGLNRCLLTDCGNAQEWIKRAMGEETQ